MKIKYTPLIFITLVIITGILGNSFLQKNDTVKLQIKNPKLVKSIREIISEKKLSAKFDNVNLFDYKSTDKKTNGYDKYLKSCTLLNLNKDNLKKLIDSKIENIVLEIPLAEKNYLSLELTEVKILSEKFEVKLITKDGIVPFNYKPGVYYSGIVKGKKNSNASISVFENSVIGIISDETGNYNLGVLEDDKTGENYVYYKESDLKEKNKFKCGVDNFGKMRINNNGQVNSGYLDNPSPRLPVRVYFVADYRMYVDKGSNTASVTNYITGFFNQVAMIYSNEYLPVEISTISIYTTPDPYVNLYNSYDILLAFGANTKDNFDGSLAHLLSTRSGGFGGISWVNTLCSQYNSSDSSGRFSFSGIDKSYLQFPTYSWTVAVVAHEMGHSFGSMHTHACWWPITQYKIGQIDSCVYVGGESCNGTPYQENNNGTLMSYCHLNGAIDLYLGFGSMPGDTVRLRYNQCAGFGPVVNSSELPTAFDLSQNYPNPFNPSTTISFAVPQDAFITIKVYDVMGREIAVLLNKRSYSQGYQNAVFNSVRYNLTSGIYFYKLSAYNSNSVNIYSQVKKMLLIK